MILRGGAIYLPIRQAKKGREGKGREGKEGRKEGRPGVYSPYYSTVCNYIINNERRERGRGGLSTST